MRSFFTVFCLFFLSVNSVNAQLSVYPQGMINPRVPEIANVLGGAKGKVFASQDVMLGYTFGNQLGDTTHGKMSFAWRSNLIRAEKTSLVLAGDTSALALRVLPASEGRKVQLAWMTPPSCDMKFASGSVTKAVTTDVSSSVDWRDVLITWDATQATLSMQNKVIATLPVDKAFVPHMLWVDAWGVDELSLQAAGKLTLDWESDYAARLSPAPNLTADTTTVSLLGFDSFVVGDNASARDYPMMQVNNASAAKQHVAMQFSLKGELAEKTWRWEQSFDVNPTAGVTTPIAFPQPLHSDVYHLSMNMSVGDRKIPLENRHFLFTPRRDELAGPSKFGLHDCNVRVFGFWPDALPINLSHVYMYWGYIQGPGWVKDWDGKYGLDPAVPADEWYWNPRVDWAVDRGNDVLVSLQSTPFTDWARAEAYPHMRKYPWGQVGGHPKLDLYRNFLREVAKRYKGKVAIWEVENEPNAGGHIPADRFENYVAICKAVYEELKSADPDTQVFGICGTSNFQEWMDKVLSHGGSNVLDGVSWHTYTSPNTPDEINFPKIIKQSVDIVKKYMPDAPIINSETGVYIVLRDKVDQAIPASVVADRVRKRDVSFVANGWMGEAFDEWQGGAGIVTNAVYNFLGGVEKYVFFGWNPLWPVNPQWEGKPTNFTMLSAAADGTRTPSLATLAAATLTTQMEGALIKGAIPVTLEGVRGGMFDKANGGKLAVLWAPTGRQSVMLKTQSDTLDVVDMFGRLVTVPVVDGVVVRELSALPIYVHDMTRTLTATPGPVEKIVIEPTDADRGICRLTLHNRGQAVMVGSLSPQWLVGDGELSPTTQSVNIKPGASADFTFTYKVTSDMEVIKQPMLGATVSQASAGGDVLRFSTSVKIPTRPVVRVSIADASITWVENQQAMVDAMSQAKAKVMKLERLDQVKLGHPPALASLHDEKWWGGPDELSATVKLAMDGKALVLYMDVLDVAARLPRTWPSVKGSVVELFFDFRKPGDGLSEPLYGPQTFQVLVKPSLEESVTAAPAWSPQLGEMKIQSVSQYDPKTRRYWIAMRLPWAKVPGRPSVGDTFGFDVAVNAAPADGPGRKTQMILFGTASNAKNASDFGWIVPVR